jgi:hypothetical protein
MTPIAQVVGSPLRWSQPTLMRREYELRSQEDITATLKWQNAFGSLALAETVDQKWTMKRSGFLRPSVTIREADSEQEIAAFRPNWGGEGKLQFAQGSWYAWQTTNFWRTHWLFVNQVGEPLVHFNAEFESTAAIIIFKKAAVVEIEPRAARIAELSLLAVLGWYLMILMTDDATSAAGAAVIM